MQLAEEVTDQKLIAMCQAGKDLGFTVLYNKYAKGVYNSISRIVSHTAEAEDILQDTFFIVFNDIHKLNGVQSFEAWVRRVAINRSISHLRKRKIMFSDAEPQEHMAEDAYNYDEDQLLNCKVDDVRNAIENLRSEANIIAELYAANEFKIGRTESPAIVRNQNLLMTDTNKVYLNQAQRRTDKNSALVVVTGFKTGEPSRTRTVVSTGKNTVFIAGNSAGSDTGESIKGTINGGGLNLILISNYNNVYLRQK